MKVQPKPATAKSATAKSATAKSATAKSAAQSRRGPRPVANFVISYVARVGSSALVDTLKRLPGFRVPIFEELDWFHLKEKGRLGAITEATIAEEAAALYRAAADPAVSVGFKWRIWGEPRSVAAMLRDHRVSVFSLVRNDIMEFTASLYLSDVVHKDFNAPQFAHATATSDAERHAILDRYRYTRVTADADQFFGRGAKAIADERQRLDLLRRLHAEGIEVTTLFYEDFAYKRFHFVNRLIARLGHPRVDVVPSSYLTKISSPYPSEAFANRAEILADPRMAAMLRDWEALIYAPEFAVLCV